MLPATDSNSFGNRLKENCSRSSIARTDISDILRCVREKPAHVGRAEGRDVCVREADACASSRCALRVCEKSRVCGAGAADERRQVLTPSEPRSPSPPRGGRPRAGPSPPGPARGRGLAHPAGGAAGAGPDRGSSSRSLRAAPTSGSGAGGSAQRCRCHRLGGCRTGRTSGR
ncbi:uncharacterized protein LOC133627216 [Colius striatus]|uniref:uncharacterized protein LOC133627216 n=1 Tax=Colius striatus TaxID=57412 RepID=UPI002B1D1D3F|nr:uncharacterized protein LOC133627216 [Colius striatus]